MSKSNFDPSRIKHIIFDLGGVLLNINYQLTVQAFKDLGFANFDLIYSQAKQDGLFDDFEKGLITRELFISSLSERMNIVVSNKDIEKAWNAMLLDFPIHRVRLLQDLKKKFNLFLLSNTNEIHFEAFNNIFKNSFKQSFSSFFVKDYYSHELGKRKPDAEVFEFLLTEQGIEANQTLFIDDSHQHLIGAQNVGLNVLFLEKGKEINEELSRLNILT